MIFFVQFLLLIIVTYYIIHLNTYNRNTNYNYKHLPNSYLPMENILDYSICKNGIKTFLFNNVIKERIMKINNYSILKSFEYINKEFRYMQKDTDINSKQNLEKQKIMIKNSIV